MLSRIQIVFLIFIIYSVFGWTMETVLFAIENKKIVNRGFLIGPCCPIYGFGCLSIIYFLEKYLDDPIALFIFASIICSVLEYLTSYIMEKIYKARWWDYSNIKFNINGRICLQNSVIFGALAFLVMYFVNPWIVSTLESLPDILVNIISYIIMIILAVDIFTSIIIMNKVKQISFSVKKDNTAEITKKVKELLMNGNFFIKRINDAFPNLKSTLKSKKQEFEEKKIEVMKNLRKNINFNKWASLQVSKTYKVKGDEKIEDEN